ncbi:CHAT domain-containing protein [candidate division KSB1 bacterium]|nr:CHAT domain-containing protein [candidate division KSB1 bacterium]
MVFEGSGGEPDLVDAERLGQRLRQIGPRLILLNACATGEGIEKGAFINIGRELQRTTGAAVIAQQYSISDLGGILLSDAFYKTFAETLSPELALNRARQIIAGIGDTLPSDWASPVYFIR